MGWQDDKVVAAPASGGWQNDAVVAPAKPATQLPSYGATDLAASKFTFGLGDKVGALGTALGGAISDAVHGGPVVTSGHRYDDALAAQQTARANYVDAHPAVDWATSPLNWLGGGAPVKAVAEPLLSIAARIAAAKSVGTVAGAVGGGVQAAGSSHGGLLQQGGQIAAGAGLGAVTGRYAPGLIASGGRAIGNAVTSGGRAIGGIMPGPVQAGASKLGGMLSSAADWLAPSAPTEIGQLAERAAQNGVPSPSEAAPQPTAAAPSAPTTDAIPSPGLGGLATNNTATKAQAYIGDRLYADGTDPAWLAKEMTTAQGRGQPYAPMDSGPAMQRAAASIARKSGPGSKIITDAVGARQLGQGERIQGAIGRDLGPTTGVAMASQKLDESAAANAKPLYESAYAQGAVDDPVINALALHPEMKAAIDAGKQIHADETFMANAKGEAPPEPLPADGFDVRSLDYTKRALDRKIDAAYSGDGAAKMQIPMLKDLRTTLLGRLDQAVPDYAAARAAYSGPKRSAEALQMGQAAVNKSGDQIAAETSKMTPAELDQYRLGHRSGMSDLIDSRPDGGDKVRSIIGSPKRRVALEQLYGGTDGLANLQGSLAHEAAMNTTYQRVTGNSKTAENTLDDADLSHATEIARGLAHLAKANPLPLIGVGVRAGLDKFAGEAGQRLRTQVAGMLAENNPALIHNAFAAAHARNLARGMLTGKIAAPSGAAAGQAAGGLLSMGGN